MVQGVVEAAASVEDEAEGVVAGAATMSILTDAIAGLTIMVVLRLLRANTKMTATAPQVVVVAVAEDTSVVVLLRAIQTVAVEVEDTVRPIDKTLEVSFNYPVKI